MRNVRHTGSNILALAFTEHFGDPGDAGPGTLDWGKFGKTTSALTNVNMANSVCTAKSPLWLTRMTLLEP